MYAGIVVDKYGKVPEHVREAVNMTIYDILGQAKKYGQDRTK